MPAERLQKLMAAAGIGSRRTCETLISEGRVHVNGKTVTELGVKADPARDRITVDGKRLEFQPQHVYYKVHKPRGVISDIGGDEVDLRTGELRRTVDDLLPPGHTRVFPVGRLDLHSEGLVLLTDDGELANRLTHPRYQHPKTYYVLLGEQPTQEALVRLRNGVDLPEGRSAPAEVMIVGYLPATLKLSKGPIREYGGWGIRGSSRRRALNARGNLGVLLTRTDGTTLLVGSQHPRELLESLSRAGVATEDRLPIVVKEF